MLGCHTPLPLLALPHLHQHHPEVGAAQVQGEEVPDFCSHREKRISLGALPGRTPRPGREGEEGVGGNQRGWTGGC